MPNLDFRRSLGNAMTETIVPRWTVGDRMRKARISAGISTQQMADHLVRNRNTVTNYETGATKPTNRVLVRWAELCNVPTIWLEDGTPPVDGGSITDESWSACTRWPVEIQDELPFGETIEAPDTVVVPFRRAPAA